MGVSSFFSEVLRDSNPSNARLRRSLANRQLDADCSLRFAPKANRPSNPSSSAKKRHFRVSLLSFLKLCRIRTHPMQGSGGALPIGSSMPIAPYDLPQRQIGHRIPHPLPRGCSNSPIFLALAAGPPNKPDFNRVEFDPVKNGAGSDALFMLPQNAFIQSTENALRCRLGTGGHSFNQKLRGCYKGFFPVTASKWYFTMPRSSPKSLCPSPG